jgi:pyrimidine-nucleoside phosphorylase
MNFLDLILKKRNNKSLSKEEIGFFISKYVQGDIPDYQVSAFLMAVWFSKMDARETADLTFAMRDSGDVVELSGISGVKADKHSTGGVGDTTTLIVAPLVAACGLKVAKMSGRSLGHTGGTLDKLESIPGVSTAIGMERFKQIVSQEGLAIVGQTNRLVPADKKLYALRDVTGTVDNTSLIAASIMSKKLALGSDVIVLDVKVGSGAFMQRLEDARDLAESMVAVGRAAGKNITALVTDMNQPLGNAIGNALEVREAIEILQGKRNGDLKTVSIALAQKMLVAGGKATDGGKALSLLDQALSSGKALEKLEKMIAAQGGDPKICQDTSLLPKAETIVPVRAGRTGIINKMRTGRIGTAALLLGAGRVNRDDAIDPAVGICMVHRLGDFIKQGDVLARLHVNDPKNLDLAISRFQSALAIGQYPPKKTALIHDIIG